MNQFHVPFSHRLSGISLLTLLILCALGPQVRSIGQKRISSLEPVTIECLDIFSR